MALTPARPLKRSINPFRALQVHRNFRLFWTGQTVSLIGTWMQSVGQGWLALELTDSAFLVGVVAAAAMLSGILSSRWRRVGGGRPPKPSSTAPLRGPAWLYGGGRRGGTWSGRDGFFSRAT